MPQPTLTVYIAPSRPRWSRVSRSAWHVRVCNLATLYVAIHCCLSNAESQPRCLSIWACVQINQTQWQNLVNDCDLFSPAQNCLKGGIADPVTGSACRRPHQSDKYWLTSVTEGKFAIQRYDFDTGIMPNAGGDWRTVQGEGVSFTHCTRSHGLLRS